MIMRDTSQLRHSQNRTRVESPKIIIIIRLFTDVHHPLTPNKVIRHDMKKKKKQVIEQHDV